MSRTLTGLFDNFADAERAVRDLEQAGVPHGDISIVGNDPDRRDLPSYDNGADTTTGNVAADTQTGAGLGATVGGVGGLLAGLGMLAIPGLGPVVAAGWLASTVAGALGGAVVGGAAGGLVGALTHAGVPENDAHVYAEGVRRGGSLVTAKVDDALIPEASAILANDRSVDVEARRGAYQNEGWNRFDESAPADTSPGYTADTSGTERRYQDSEQNR